MSKKFGISLYCFLPWVAILPFPVEFWIALAKKLGYDGIEYRPVNGMIYHQMRRGNLSKYAKAGILSGEISYQWRRSFNEARKQEKNKAI